MNRVLESLCECLGSALECRDRMVLRGLGASLTDSAILK